MAQIYWSFRLKTAKQAKRTRMWKKHGTNECDRFIGANIRIFICNFIAQKYWEREMEYHDRDNSYDQEVFEIYYIVR